MNRLLSCEFNIDTGNVELRYADGSMISIDCIEIEHAVATSINARSELDWLIYNAPLEYAELVAMSEVIKYMYDHFDEIYKAPKIFISHSTDDRPIVEKFVTMLEQIGVKQDQLFCSSIAGYGIPQGAGDLYDFIRNEMGNDNLFVIMMLSQNYYSSPVCLNEMGAAWVKQSAYQSILLPGFQYSEIKGAVNPRDITFCLDDRDNRNYALNELKDRIVKHLGINDVSQNRWERFRDKFLDEIDCMSK